MGLKVHLYKLSIVKMLIYIIPFSNDFTETGQIMSLGLQNLQ